ncbi:MAG: hypothetical protein AABX52_02100 [Nanoarchaeota archaeon]
MTQANHGEGLEEICDSTRYKLGRLRGRGCWGAVYEAQDTYTGMTVAIKIQQINDVAQAQLSYRNKTLEDATLQEALFPA